jgi:hypothetical protein
MVVQWDLKNEYGFPHWKRGKHMTEEGAYVRPQDYDGTWHV